MASNRIEVTRLDDGQVMVQKGSWRDIFHEDRRHPWADWYEAMHAERGYQGYLDMAEALRALPPL